MSAGDYNIMETWRKLKNWNGAPMSGTIVPPTTTTSGLMTATTSFGGPRPAGWDPSDFNAWPGVNMHGHELVVKLPVEVSHARMRMIRIALLAILGPELAYSLTLDRVPFAPEEQMEDGDALAAMVFNSELLLALRDSELKKAIREIR